MNYFYGENGRFRYSKIRIENGIQVVKVTIFPWRTWLNIDNLGALNQELVREFLGKKISVNVGSGFSDANRDDFWNSRTNITGQLVEVRADAVTQNQDGTYSLRFPRFKTFRGFEPGEKL